MSGVPYKVDVDSKIPQHVTSIVIALVASAGATGGAYFAAHEREKPPQNQFELYTPAMRPDSKSLFVFKYDKVTGKTWQLELGNDRKGRWDLVIDP
jgi:hypothetical protein